MYGFGDAESPRQDTVELLDEMVVDYITDIVYIKLTYEYINTFFRWLKLLEWPKSLPLVVSQH